MLRVLLCTVTLLGFVVAASAQNQADKATNKTDKATAAGEKNKTSKEATITKVNAKKGQITVKMKDKNGKDVEKTFTLTEDVRMLDSTGRVAAIDVFQSGNEILVIEADGKLREIHKKGPTNTNVKEKSK